MDDLGHVAEPTVAEEERRTSPTRMPAWAAGEFGATEATKIPEVWGKSVAN